VPDRRLVAAAALLLPAVLALAVPAGVGWRVAAHAQLVASSPGPGEILAVAPAELRLVFSEPLEAGFTALDLGAADGTPLLTGVGEVDPADEHQLVASLPALTEGVYLVTWRNVSAADGHATDGFFSFGVGDIEPGSTLGSGQQGHAVLEPWWPIPRLASYAGILPALGLPLFALVVLRRRPSAMLGFLLAGLLALGAVGSLASGFAGADAAGHAPPVDYLLMSRGGQLQLTRSVVLAIAAAATLAATAVGATRLACGVAAFGGLAAIFLIALGAHAGAIGPTTVLADVVHIAAAAAWLGGLIGLGLLLTQPRWLAPELPPAQVALPRFSALALVAISLLAATGVYADWIHTDTLVTTADTYGITLIVKVALAACALGVGAANFLDGGRRPRWLGGTRFRVAAEATLALAVLGVTSVLSVTPPETARAVAVEPRVPASGGIIPGLSLELLPGRPGVNRVIFVAEGALGDRPVELVLDRLDTGGQTRIPLAWQDPGTGAAHGVEHAEGMGRDHYIADAVVLPAGSQWDATVRVMSSAGSEIARQAFAFSLDDAAVSDGRLGPAIDVALILAAAMALGGALALGLGAGGWSLPRTDAAASRLALVAGGGIGVALGLVIAGGRMVGIG
jgi:copper transport protein